SGRAASATAEAWIAGQTPAALADLEPMARQSALVEAAARALADAATALGGLAIGLDDWQRSDAASRQVVAACARLQAPWRWALAGDEAPAPEKAEAFVLAPLGAPEARALVESRLGG